MQTHTLLKTAFSGSKHGYIFALHHIQHNFVRFCEKESQETYIVMQGLMSYLQW